MVHREPAWHSYDETRGLSAIKPQAMVIDRIRMKRVGHGDFKIADFLRTALSHRASLLHKTFALDPQAGLKHCRNPGPVLRGQRQQVAQVVGMGVGQENRVQPCDGL